MGSVGLTQPPFGLRESKQHAVERGSSRDMDGITPSFFNKGSVGIVNGEQRLRAQLLGLDKGVGHAGASLDQVKRNGSVYGLQRLSVSRIAPVREFGPQLLGTALAVGKAAQGTGERAQLRGSR